jgi:hypothetical protein
MKTLSGVAAVALCAALGAGSTALAQDAKVHSETTTKQTGPGPDVKAKAETVTGTVKEYEAGKRIKISGPGDKTYAFDLDEAATVNGTIVTGQMATVTFHKTADGREHVSVVSKASHAAQAAVSAPKVHSESTMTESRPGLDAKTKTEVVIGTVKEFEPGKKIKVTGPKDKDFDFDLDQSVAMQGTFSVGERVKVTYTKGPSGHKVTTVEPYRGQS